MTKYDECPPNSTILTKEKMSRERADGRRSCIQLPRLSSMPSLQKQDEEDRGAGEKDQEDKTLAL